MVTENGVYVLGSGIAITEDRIQNVVSLHLTDEELLRNHDVRAAVRVIAEAARTARNHETVLSLEQPTQPTQVALKPTQWSSPLAVDNPVHNTQKVDQRTPKP
jgi:hypothetical protein